MITRKNNNHYNGTLLIFNRKGEKKMENQVTEKAVENVVEKTVEVATDVVPAVPNVGLKELAYVGLGAGLTLATVVGVKKGKKLVQKLKDKRTKKVVVVDGGNKTE
jgi:hypothetical protein